MTRIHTHQPTEKWKGLRTGVDPASIDDAELSIADNVVFDESGGINKRKGIYIVSTETPLTLTGSFKIFGIVRRPGNNSYMIAGNSSKIVRWKNVGTWTLGNWEEVQKTGPASIANTGGILEWGTAAFPFQTLIYTLAGAPQQVIQAYALLSIAGTVNGPPSASQVVFYKQRLFSVWGSDLTGIESRIWYTGASSTDYTLGTTIDVAAGQGERIVSLVVYHDHLYIFKEHSIYVLNADGDPSTWVVRLVTPYLGSAGIKTPRVINGYLYFVSGEGVYRTDGTTFDEISKPIRDVFQDRQYVAYSDFDNTIAEFWQNKYIVILMESPTVAWVYDILVEAWSKWTLPTDIRSMTTTQETIPERLYFGGYTNGLIYCMGDTGIWKDNGVGLAQTGSPTNYQVQVQSKSSDFKEIARRKRNHMTAVDCSGGNASETATLEYFKDGSIASAVLSKNFSSASARQILKFPGAGQHRTLRWNLKYSGANSFGVNGVVLDEEIKDNQESRGH